MHSSTLHSSAKVPWFALWLIALAAMGWATGCFYTLCYNPEIDFLSASTRLKQGWARQLAREEGPRVIIAGGSSCFASVDAGRLRERNVRAVNMGLAAGLGAKFLTRLALSELRPHDTLILAIEPHLLTTALSQPAMAVQLSYALHAPDLLRDLNGRKPGPAETALALRPGAYHLFTLFGKLLWRQPIYRYNIAAVSPSGWHRMEIYRDFGPEAPYRAGLSADAIQLLKAVRQWCATNQVRVAYSLPWSYVPDEEAATFREHSRDLLQQIAVYVPVLKDPVLGAHGVRKHFSDTSLHLDAEGAALRTDSLAQQLTAWSIWEPAELAQLRLTTNAPAAEALVLTSERTQAEKN